MATEVVMPQMGESIAEGTITKWLKEVGEHVERDEPLFEISTDKVDAEIPSPAAGVLTEIKFKEGETVEVNTVVAVLDGGDGPKSEATPAVAEAAPAADVEETREAEAPPTDKVETPTAPPAPPEPATPPPAPKPAQPAAIAPKSTPAQRPASKLPATVAQAPGNGGRAATVEELRRTKSSPLVRKIASEHGIDIAKLEG